MPQEKQEQTKKKLLQNGIDQLLLLKKNAKKDVQNEELVKENLKD